LRQTVKKTTAVSHSLVQPSPKKKSNNIIVLEQQHEELNHITITRIKNKGQN